MIHLQISFKWRCLQIIEDGYKQMTIASVNGISFKTMFLISDKTFCVIHIGLVIILAAKFMD